MKPDPLARFRQGSPAERRTAAALSTQLRSFLDAVAAATPDPAHIAPLIADLNAWTRRLAPIGGSEDEALWRKAPRDQPPALTPAFTFVEDGIELTGSVTFGRFHVGRGAAHGGAISLVFDELMGALANGGDRPMARTAYLHVNFRALTPIDQPLAVRARFDREEGRKRFLRASISDGETICAEAHGLWITIR